MQEQQMESKSEAADSGKTGNFKAASFLLRLGAALQDRFGGTDFDKIADRLAAILLNNTKETDKDGLLFKAALPIIDRIIWLLNDVEKDVEEIKLFISRDDHSNAADTAGKTLGYMLDTLYGVLRLYDISPFTCEGAQFDPHRQRVVKTIKTQDESLFKTVSERLCRGYERNGVVLSREQVAAYVVEKE